MYCRHDRTHVNQCACGLCERTLSQWEEIKTGLLVSAVKYYAPVYYQHNCIWTLKRAMSYVSSHSFQWAHENCGLELWKPTQAVFTTIRQIWMSQSGHGVQLVYQVIILWRPEERPLYFFSLVLSWCEKPKGLQNLVPWGKEMSRMRIGEVTKQEWGVDIEQRRTCGKTDCRCRSESGREEDFNI